MASEWYRKMGDHDFAHYGEVSLFAHEEKRKYRPPIPQYQTLTAVEGTTFTPSAAGAEVWNFIPQFAGPRLSSIMLYLEAPALTFSGINRAGGDICCYHNDLVRMLHSRLELVDGGDVSETVLPFKEHWDLQVQKRNDTRQPRERWSWWSSEEDASDAATATQKLCWEIPLHLVDGLDRALRMDEMQGHDLRIRFYWRSKGDMTYCHDYSETGSGGATEFPDATAFTFTNVKLLMTYYPLSEAERTQFYRKPFSFRRDTVQQKAEYLLSAVSSATIPLNNFSYPVSGLLFRIRDSTTVRQGAKDCFDRNWRNEEVISTLGFKVDGAWRYETTLPMEFWTDMMAYRLWPSLPEEAGWYYLPFEIAPLLRPDVVTGTFNFSMTNNPELILTFSGATSGYVDVYAITPNVFSYKVDGTRTTISVLFK
jgi:hypothetical protein